MNWKKKGKEKRNIKGKKEESKRKMLRKKSKTEKIGRKKEIQIEWRMENMKYETK